MNSREEFHMNIFDILCTSTQGQNFAEGQGHWEMIYSTLEAIGSFIWFECMTNFGQYIHVK